MSDYKVNFDGNPIDLTDIFHPLVGDTLAPVTNFLTEKDGEMVDLNQVFEPIASGGEILFDTEFVVDDVDLRKIFAGKDTVRKTRASVQSCIGRRLAFIMCNSNAAKDCNFAIEVNGNWIGNFIMNQNRLIGGVAIGKAPGDPNWNLVDSPVTCPPSGLDHMYFDEELLEFDANNSIFCRNISNTGNGNFGDVRLVSFAANTSTGTLSEPRGMITQTYAGESGASFGPFNFNFTSC